MYFRFAFSVQIVALDNHGHVVNEVQEIQPQERYLTILSADTATKTAPQK
jgi:hypothetical protein